MNALKRILDWVFSNGYDLSVQEDAIQHHKARAKNCMEASETHFQIIREKFDTVTPDPEADENVEEPQEHPSCDSFDR